jgi:Bacterial SH3 domain
MKRARVLLWVIGVLMCVISILLFTSPIDVFDRDDQPKPTSQNVAPAKEAARLAPTETAPQQPDQLDVLHLDAPAQNSPHAIAPDVEPPAVASPATETKSSATADPIEAPSTAAPRDEFATITTTVTIRNGPSASADVIGRAHAGARARVASRDSGWSQIVDPASGNTGWVESNVLVPSPTPETVAAEESTGEAPDATLDTPLEDQSSQISKKAHSATKSRQAAKAKHHRANHNYGRRRFAFRFFFRGFLR